MSERLHKVLAVRGLASRREAERLIGAGVVSVNGRVARVGEVVDPESDVITVHGAPLPAAPSAIHVAMNKPVGVVTSSRRMRNEEIVLDVIPLRERLVPVGRLDKDTSGLLLLTNDGEWLNSIAHPRFQVEKEYVARVRGLPSLHALEALRHGVRLPGGETTSPAKVRVIRTETGYAQLSVTVSEGKKRQIRLMCQAVGHPVLELERVRIGPLRLGGLQPGHWRHLTPQEVSGLARAGRGSASTEGARTSDPNRH